MKRIEAFAESFDYLVCIICCTGQLVGGQVLKSVLCHMPPVISSQAVLPALHGILGMY